MRPSTRLFLVTPIMLGCARGHSLEGGWATRQGNGRATLTLDRKGTFSMSIDASGFMVVESGTYSASLSSLVLTPSSITVSNPKLPSDKLTTYQRMAERDLRKNQTATLEWRTDDEIVVSLPGKQGIIFDRTRS